MRNVLEEFHKTHHGQRTPTILGLREHIFTGRFDYLLYLMNHDFSGFIFVCYVKRRNDNRNDSGVIMVDFDIEPSYISVFHLWLGSCPIRKLVL